MRFITYQTAYMKANYPVEFMAASMTLETGNTDKIAEFRREAIRLGIAVEPPSVNRSGVEFDVDDGRILYSLAAIKGVGAQAVEHLVEARGDKPFRDLADFGQPHQSADHQQARRWKASSPPAPSTSSSPTAPASIAGIDRILGHGDARPGQRRERPDRHVRRRRRSASRCSCRSVEPWLAGREAAARARRGRLLSLAPIRSTNIAPSCRRCASRPGRNSPSPSAAAPPPAASPAPSPRGRSGASRTGNRMGAVQLSDPTGSYEARRSSRRASPNTATSSSPGSSVVVLVSAEERPEGINVRIQSVEPLDKFMAGLKQIRVFLRDEAPLPSVAEASRPARARARSASS